MQRYDFYFRQKVRHTELDSAFDAVENALVEFLEGFGYIGIANGADVVEHNPTANFTVDISGPGLIYNQLGERIAWSADQNVDMTIDENGTATAVSTSGNEKYLSVFAEYERSLTDPRTDGNGATVFFDRAESFSLNVVQGVEAPTGTAVKPSLRSDQILLGDVLITYGMTEIENADIELDRAEYPFDLTGSPTAVKEKGLQDVLQAMLDELNTFSGAAALLTSSNTFTATNTFQDDVTFEDPIFAEDKLEFSYGLALTTPRLYINTDFVTSEPSPAKLLVAQLSNNASGTGNVYLYASEDGIVISIGCRYASGWYYDSGVSSAWAIYFNHAGDMVVKFRDGSTGWTDAQWNDTWFTLDDSGVTAGTYTNHTVAYKFGATKSIAQTYTRSFAFPRHNLTSSLPDWVMTTNYWRTQVNGGVLEIPIRFPRGVGFVTFQLDVMVKPGAARSSGNRLRAWLDTMSYNWSTPGAPSSSVYDSAEDDGTTDDQLLTISGNPTPGVAEDWRIRLIGGSDAGSNRDFYYGIRVTWETDGQPIVFTGI